MSQAQSPAGSLDVLFRPRSVAVVGASRRPQAIGHQIFKNLLDAGFQGPVYPVNPGAESIRSVRAYPSLASIGAPVDLAVICVPAARALDAIREAGEAGVKGLIVISAGFGETGGEGAQLQGSLRGLLDQYGMRAVGPNCLGVVHTDPAVRLNATFAPQYPPPGKVAFASQSGALGVAILDHARTLGIGIRSFVSVGNRVDLSLHELLAHWRDDPETEVVLLYLESFGDPVRFARVAQEVSRETPIVAVKSGRTLAGQKAASSHTGALAGRDAAADALFHQAGVIRVDTVEELFDTAMLVANQPLPRGRRLGILTNAGGPGIMAADCAESESLQVPVLSGALQQQLREFLPAEASTTNPVDMVAAAGPDEFDRASRLLLESGEVDALLVVFVPPVASDTGEVARRIVARTDGSDLPVVTCFLGTHGVPEALQALEGGDVPSYRYPEAAVRALARAGRYREWRQRDVVPPGRFDDVDARRALAALNEVGDDGWLTPGGARGLLEAYGIHHVDTRFAATEEQAAAVSEELGYPLVMKLDAEGVLHKSDVQGVRLGLRSADQVRTALRTMRENLEARGQGASFRGVLLQPQVAGGTEVAVGTVTDPAFGPLLMVGTGGVNLELLRDVRFLLPPLDAGKVREAVHSLRGYPLLDGYRGRPKADQDALEELILRVGQLLEDHPSLVEMDLNPVMVLPEGRGCTVVDVRVKLAN